MIQANQIDKKEHIILQEKFSYIITHLKLRKNQANLLNICHFLLQYLKPMRETSQVDEVSFLSDGKILDISHQHI